MKNKFYTVIIALFLSSNSLIAYVQIDEIAPDFQLKNSFGDNVSLSDYRGKMVILEWTKSWLPICCQTLLNGQYAINSELCKG